MSIQEEMPRRNRLLLAAGTSTYQDGLPDLSGLPEDVRMVADALARFGYQGSESRYLLDPQVQELKQAIATAAGEAPVVIVYYASHAVKPDRGPLYLLTADSDADKPETTALRFEEILTLVHRHEWSSPAQEQPQVLVILDCSYAGAAGTEALQASLRDVGNPNVWVLASTGSWGWAQSGLFSRALAGALHNVSVGRTLPFIHPATVVERVNAIMEAGNEDQLASLFSPRGVVSGPVPPFFPNPEYTPNLNDVPLSPYAQPTVEGWTAGGRWQLSLSASEVVAKAHTLAAASGASGGELAPSLLLLSALSMGFDGGNETVSPLCPQLFGAGEEEDVLAALSSALNVPLDATFSAKPSAMDATLVADYAVIRQAYDITIRLGVPPVLEIRHLVAAVLTSSVTLPSSVLHAFPVPLRTLRHRLRQAIAVEAPDEAPDRWDNILGVITETTQLAGGISRDLVDAEERIPLEDDHLGVGTYVTMLATVIAGRDTPLPLSVGLFGEWGSGKSYFMGLLREQVGKLADSGDDAYMTDVVPITFNAWHYADTNLWASLGNEIFEQLAGPKATADERRHTLREELADKLQRAQELKLANEQAERVTARLREELDQARSEAARSATLLAKSATASRTLLTKVWRRLGVQDAVDQGELLADEIRQSGTEVNALKLAISGPHGMVAALLAAVALGLLATSMFLGDIVATRLAGVGLGGLAAALTWAAVAVRRVRSGLSSLRTVADEIRKEIETTTEEKVAEDMQRLRRADARKDVLQSQLTEVLQRAGELGGELAALSPGQRWYGFVSERASSDEYRRELGLISTIRRDFEHLIELMKDWSKLNNRDEQHRPIDRIVLYIDDLDRCSPRQVVDVLQAVHLLLALDLFVVVVGVDPRWLLHSLREQYASVFRGGEDGSLPAGRDRPDEEAVWRSTPHDYLEKIFNIPFVLPGMTGTSFERLIRELSLVEEAPNPDDDRGRKNSIQTTPPQEQLPPTETGKREQRTDNEALTPEQHSSSAPAPADLPAEARSKVATVLSASARPAELPPQGLTEDELNLLAALAPLVRSPRQAKRLLNLYRMVRSTRDLSPASDFIGSESVPGQFEAVGVLLGLLTTHPRLLGQLIAFPPGDRTAGGLRSRPSTQSWHQVVQGLRPRSSDRRWCNDISDDLSDADCREWAELVHQVGPATALVRLPDITAFQLWGPRVTRFSFVLSPLAGQEEQVIPADGSTETGQ
jgi:hypothetical protein